MIQIYVENIKKNNQLNYIVAFYQCFELLSFYLFKNVLLDLTPTF